MNNIVSLQEFKNKLLVRHAENMDKLVALTQKMYQEGVSKEEAKLGRFLCDEVIKIAKTNDIKQECLTAKTKFGIVLREGENNNA